MYIRPSQEHAITAITSTTASITIRASAYSGEPSRLFVNDQEIGYVEEQCDYPGEVTILAIETSSSTHLQIASHALPYRRVKKGYGYSGRLRSFAFHGMVPIDGPPVRNEEALESLQRYQTSGHLSLWHQWHSAHSDHLSYACIPSHAVEIDYEMASRLSPPIVLVQDLEYPFHQMPDGGMTNLSFTFPPSRPFGRSEWYEYQAIRFAMEIRDENWPLLLSAVEGAFFEDICNSERLRGRMRNHLGQGSAQLQPGQCIDASLFDEFTAEVSVGHRMVFRGRIGENTLYIVDGPNYGVGLYVFRELRHADDWANGRISPEEARHHGRFIPHADGWQGRLLEIISEMESQDSRI